MFNFNFSKSVEEFKAAGSSLLNGVVGLTAIAGVTAAVAAIGAVAFSFLGPASLPYLYLPLEVAVFVEAPTFATIASALPTLGVLSVAGVVSEFPELVLGTVTELGSAVVNAAKAIYHAGEAIFGSNEDASNPTHQIEPKPDFGTEVEKADFFPHIESKNYLNSEEIENAITKVGIMGADDHHVSDVA